MYTQYRQIFQNDLLRSASWTLADQNSGELKMGSKILSLGTIIIPIIIIIIIMISIVCKKQNKKTKTQPKRKTVCGVSSLSENVNIVNLKSEPQRETQTQQRAWFSWHGVARGAVRDSHTRRRHGTRAVR